MSLNDDGNIIHAVGFVAVYSAHLEDRLMELIDLTKRFTALHQDILHLHINDQARHLRTALEKQFRIVPDYLTKKEEQRRTTNILKAVEKVAKKRNQAIHSVLISNNAGIVMQNNRRQNFSKQIKSKEIYALADYIFELQKGVFGLQFCVKTLQSNLRKTT